MNHSNTEIVEHKATIRSSNLELFRIVAMLFIVLSHYHFFLDGQMAVNPTSPMSLYHYCIGNWGKMGINCFMLITGYFMCTKEITVKKYIKLLAQIYFYNIVIGCLFVIFGAENLTVSSLQGMLFPFVSINIDRFVTDFLWFYLFIPFVSILIRNLNQTQHRRLLLLCAIVFVLYNQIPGLFTSVNPIVWFSVIMLLASYVRFYGCPFFENKNIRWGVVCILTFLLAFASIIVCVYVGRNPYRFVTPSNTIFAILVSFSMFMFFLNLRIPYNKYINLLGGAAFGVLLIHSNCQPMRELVFEHIFDTRRYFAEANLYMPIVAPLCIYLVCAIIENIRQKTVEKPFLSLLYKLFRLK